VRYNDYPIEYQEMFDRALGKPVELTFSTRAKAVSFRVELYKFRYAVRDALPLTEKRYTRVMKITLSVRNKTLVLQTKKSKFVEKLNDN